MPITKFDDDALVRGFTTSTTTSNCATPPQRLNDRHGRSDDRMAGFVGATVQLILNQPPNTEVHGIVEDIVAGQTLSLTNAYFPATTARYPTFTVQSTAIADVKILSTKQDEPVQLKDTIPAQAPRRVDTKLGTIQQHPPDRQSPVTHADPAILSYERTRPHQPASTTIHPSSDGPLPVRSLQQHQPPQQDTVKRKQHRAKQNLQDDVSSSRKNPPVVDTETSRHGNVMDNTAKRGKGWRQTPLLQPTGAPASEVKRSRKRRDADGDAQNGWATEEATDIQDMGEFDFEANHKLFDKQQVFDELRKGDTTADEDRLVSHNKHAPRKNLLPSENVLSPKVEVDDKGSDADTEVDFHTGRSSSRHSLSRRHQSRTNHSTLHEGRPPHAAGGTASSDRLLVRSATASSRTSRPQPTSTGSATKADRHHSPLSAGSKRTDTVGSSSTLGSRLYIGQSGVRCPVLYPSALNLLEQETCSRYGVPLDVITENAARGIAEEANRLIESPNEARRGSRTHTFRSGLASSGHGFENVPPVVVVLVKAHALASRALAAARQLSSRGYKIIIAEAHAQQPNEQFGKQLSIIKRMMRSGANIKRGSWSKANEYVKSLSGPPVLIIDALLSGAKYEDAEDGGEKESDDIHKMIDWANRSRAAVLSLSCPSGLSEDDGSATIVDGEPLAIKADKVVALGAPVTGVLEALKLGERFDISLADIGINIALKADDAVRFGTQWSVQLTFTSSEQGDEAMKYG